MTTKNAIIIFLDGVGLGDANLEVNPFMHVEMALLRQWWGMSHLTREAAGARNAQAAILGLDARLGVAGLPQSATGQTAILTGLNAPEGLGEHYGPYPNQLLRDLLRNHSLFRTLVDQGQPVAYANAYPDRFLDRITRGKGRLSANTNAALMAGLKLRGRQDLQQGRAIAALLDNNFWPETGVNLPSLTAFQAGQQLVDLAQDYALTFFEFWYSDWLGHKMDRAQSLSTVRQLDDFLQGVLNALDLSRSLLLVVSDHGNFEDWTTKKHTLNAAAAIVAGNGTDQITPRLKTLTDIAPAVLAYFSQSGEAGFRN